MMEREGAMVKFLVGFSRVWFGLAILVNVIALIGKIGASDSLRSGILGALAWLNPGNTSNFVTEILLFSPAVGAYLLAERLAARDGDE
jgi:hypothetical protein